MSRTQGPKCELHPAVPKYKLDARAEEKRAACEDCAPWQRYVLYALPALVYLPWAISKLRCPPKCCPPPSCYSSQPCALPRQYSCAEHDPARGHINPAPPVRCPDKGSHPPPPCPKEGK